MAGVTTSQMDGNQRVIKGDYVSHFFVTAVHTWEDSFEENKIKGQVRDTRCLGYAPTFERIQRNKNAEPIDGKA